MGFKTGSHGKVYNDSKSKHGSPGSSPGHHDGSSSTVREYPESFENRFNNLSNHQKYLLTKHAGLTDFTDNTDVDYSNFTRGEKKVINETMDELGIWVP